MRVVNAVRKNAEHGITMNVSILQIRSLISYRKPHYHTFVHRVVTLVFGMIA